MESDEARFEREMQEALAASTALGMPAASPEDALEAAIAESLRFVNNEQRDFDAAIQLSLTSDTQHRFPAGPPPATPRATDGFRHEDGRADGTCRGVQPVARFNVPGSSTAIIICHGYERPCRLTVTRIHGVFQQMARCVLTRLFSLAGHLSILLAMRSSTQLTPNLTVEVVW